jgi:DNA gyrase subunit A
MIAKTNKDQFLAEEELSSVLDSRFTKYAFMSLEDRALPDARDGLKPSQRRVLVAMNDLNLSAGGATEKCAKICGDTSGNYHPHGEAVVYPTMYRLVQPWVMRYPLLIGQGNFGNPDGDPPAAMRYTEAKLSRLGETMLDDLSDDVVPYALNYNEKRQEPTILPSLLPNLLVNGCEGIAVGWATKMLPHNLREVVAVIKKYIENPKIKVDKLLKLMPGPDFPTGGKILGNQGVLDYYQTGRGSIKIEGTYVIDKKSIIITELPYQSSPDQLCGEIKNLVEANKITGISDLKNLSSKKTGIRVVIEVAKNGNANLILNNLLRGTCLRKSISINQTVLIDGKVVPEAGLLQLVEAFVNHRKAILTKKYEAELARATARIHILEGLIGIVDKIDAVIKVIRNSDSPEDAEAELIQKRFVKSIEQAKAVLSITLRQLTKLEGNKLKDECEKLRDRVEWLKKVLANTSEILNLIVQEQEELAKKMGDDRRSQVVQDVEEIADEDLIKNENLMVSLTGDGYVKSVPLENFKMQGRGGAGSLAVNKSDNAENIFEMFETKSKSYVLFFTNTGMVYQRKAYEIPQGTKTGKGLHVSNLLSLDVDETVTNMVSLKSLETNGYLMIVTKNGIVKKSEIKEYDTNRKTSGITAITLNKGDAVAFACVTDGKRDVFIVTQNGQCVRYSEKIVPVQGRTTRGSRALKLDYEDAVAEVFTLDAKEMPDILVVTANGYGKRTSSKEYRSLTNRQVKGYSVVKKAALKKNGNIVGACAVSKGDSLLSLTSAGKCIRIDSHEIRETGRTTAGVRIVKLDGNETVVKIAKVSAQESLE